jgi:hypothetical protein
VVITALVYGVVALIVKADDMGVALYRNPGFTGAFGRATGRRIVLAVPKLLGALATIGMAAMLWVGGGIVVHGLEEFGLGGPSHLLHDVTIWATDVAGWFGPALGWLVGATGAGAFGLALGALVVGLLHLRPSKRQTTASH